ncbi:MAG: hypothetical protein RBU45_15610, partial [Myxococcota bacterium]|nr:hypothetical protein [Myxococcota bacterium]
MSKRLPSLILVCCGLLVLSLAPAAGCSDDAGPGSEGEGEGSEGEGEGSEGEGEGSEGEGEGSE